jgi:hypothetical protein
VNDETVLAKNPHVVARELSESQGAVLLNLESGAYHGLNATAFVTWDLIDGRRTVRELVDAVRDRLTGAPPTLQTDVLHFLESARERDLIRAAS